MFFRIVCFGLLLTFTAGCGESGPDYERHPVFGKILGGEGREGWVTFRPGIDAKGSVSNTEVKNGEYRFAANKGPSSGTHTVLIRLSKGTPQAAETAEPALDLKAKQARPRNPQDNISPSSFDEVQIDVQVPESGDFNIDLKFSP